MVVKNKMLREKLNDWERTLEPPSFKDNFSLKIQLRLKQLLGYGSIYWNALKGYRCLSKKNLVWGSSSGEEVISTQMPQEYLKGMGRTQHLKAAAEVSRIKENVEYRQQVAQRYNDFLVSLGKEPVGPTSYATHTYTKFPLLVRNRAMLFSEAEKHKIPIHDWFVSQIHPVTESHEQWHLVPSDHPVSYEIAKHIINLPTDFSVNEGLKHRILEFLRMHKDEIISYKDFSFEHTQEDSVVA